MEVESEKCMAAVNWEVAPAHDFIGALMEILVDPRLPRSSSVVPSEESHNNVAKQMHAVVLLYNYYHRKQNLNLEFFNLTSFCRIASELRPSMKLFLKATKEDALVELNDADNELSVTEKSIEDACNIAMSLDASKNFPVIEGYPVTKVAVLLIDSNREKCFLKFGGITGGVWSLIEKDINESSISPDLPPEQNGIKKRKIDDKHMSTYDDKHLQIAYEAVKSETKTASSDLEVLEARVVHSLTKEKSAAQFFIMRCSQSFDKRQGVPLNRFADRLEGPLAEEDDGSWRATNIVEYYHVLPYVGFISSWLSRKESPPLIILDEAQITKTNDQKELPGNNDLDTFDINKLVDEINQNIRKRSSSDDRTPSLENGAKSTKEPKRVENNFKDIRELFSSKKEKGCKIDFTKLDETHEKDHQSGVRSQKGARDAPKQMNVSGRTRNSLKSKDKISLNLKTSYNRSKNAPNPQQDTNGLVNDADFMVETDEPPKTSIHRCRLEKMTGENGDKSTPRNHMRNASKENQSDYSVTLNNSGSHDGDAKSAIKNAIVTPDEKIVAELLFKKLMKLSSKILPLHDERVVYEDAAKQMLRGGAKDLARRCMTHFSNGDEHLLLNEILAHKDHQSNPQTQTGTKLLIPRNSSYLELETICILNNLEFPRYDIKSSDGGIYVAEINMQINGTELRSKGYSETSPVEARESCAARLLNRICNEFH